VQSTKSAIAASALFEKLVLGAAGRRETAAIDSTESILHTILLTIPMVTKLFQSLGLKIHESEALAVIRLIESSNEAVTVRSDNLRSYLCTLCSFRTIQHRLKVR
jgi:hypothetical protein